MAPALSIPRQVILSESEPRRSRPGTRPPGRRRESGAGIDGPIRRVRSQPEPHGATLRMTRRRPGMMIMIIMASEPGDELPPGGADSAAAAESDGHSGWPHRRGRDHCRRDGGLG